MRLQHLLRISSPSNIEVALSRGDRTLEDLRTDPSLEDEPGSEVDTSLFPVPRDVIGSKGLSGRCGREGCVSGRRVRGLVHELVEETHYNMYG